MSKIKKILMILGTLAVLICTLSCVEYTAYCVLAIYGRNWLFHGLIILALTISGFTAHALARIGETSFPIVSTLCYASIMMALFIVKYFVRILF